MSKETFLKVIGIPENPKGFTMQEPTPEYFQTFLDEIGYTEELKAKQFNKLVAPGL